MHFSHRLLIASLKSSRLLFSFLTHSAAPPRFYSCFKPFDRCRPAPYKHSIAPIATMARKLAKAASESPLSPPPEELEAAAAENQAPAANGRKRKAEPTVTTAKRVRKTVVYKEDDASSDGIAEPAPKKRVRKVKVEETVAQGKPAEAGEVKTKQKRQRKNKEEDSAPLEQRTVGSKLMIGAHVSIAGGKNILLFWRTEMRAGMILTTIFRYSQCYTKHHAHRVSTIQRTFHMVLFLYTDDKSMTAPTLLPFFSRTNENGKALPSIPSMLNFSSMVARNITSTSVTAVSLMARI